MKHKKIKRALSLLGFIRTFLPIISLNFDDHLRDLIFQDEVSSNYLSAFDSQQKLRSVNYLLNVSLPFRSIFYFRLWHEKHYIIYYLSQILLRNHKIDIWGDIAGGFVIYHGVGDVIVCNKAGKNFNVYQNVTIGRNPKTKSGGVDTPSFGDNVSVYANSVVIGNISIGDNVSIGAGAVVTKSVPDNCTVVGNPMRIINKKD